MRLNRNTTPPIALVCTFLVSAVSLHISLISPLSVDALTRDTSEPKLPILSPREHVDAYANADPTPEISISAAIDRPLFSERRGIVSISAQSETFPTAGLEMIDEASTLPSEAVSVLPPNIEYIGFWGGLTTRALFDQPGIEQQIWLSVGESIDGWTVIDISQDSVTLSKEHQRFIAGFNQ